MHEHARLCESIAATIGDYRAGESPPPTLAHVDRWVQQFDDAVQVPLLAELNHVLMHTYFSRARAEAYFRALIRDERLAGLDPAAFWRSVTFLSLQSDGRSQGAMLSLLDGLLADVVGLSIEECGLDGSRFVYLDDGVFSGNQISRDLSGWIRSDHCPDDAHIDIVCLALHKGGEWNAIRPGGYIEEAKGATGKPVSFRWWPDLRLENRLSRLSTSDVLAPNALPDDELVKEYSANLGRDVTFRTGESLGELRFFSAPEARSLLEQQLLKAGAQIREMARNLNGYQRPLGNSTFAGLGFGTMVVTYRNCPNNAPLALWAGDPWYPLFPRRTN